MPASTRDALVARLEAHADDLGLADVVPSSVGQFQEAVRKAKNLGQKSPAAFVTGLASRLDRNGSRARLAVLLFVRDRGLSDTADVDAAALAEGLGHWLLDNAAWTADGSTYCVVEGEPVSVEPFGTAAAYAIYAVAVTVDHLQP